MNTATKENKMYKRKRNTKIRNTKRKRPRTVDGMDRRKNKRKTNESH